MTVSSVTQITVYNTDVFTSQITSAGSSIGMGPIAPGSSVSAIAQQFEANLLKNLTANFTTQFPSASLSGNTDNGYIGPITSNVAGTAPQCLVQQINQDLSNWGLPTQSNVATTLATTITTELSMQGGVTNFAHGTLQLSSNESLVWMAGYGTFNVTQSEMGAIYVFGAAIVF